MRRNRIDLIISEGIAGITRSMGADNSDVGYGDFVELPTGIFTADGIWFHTSESFLREFAGPVIERVGIGRLFSQAGIWMRSADTACAFCLVFLLLAASPAQAVLASIALYFLWKAIVPVLVFPLVIRFFSFLSAAWVQGLLYILILSWLGAGGMIASVVVGLVGFVLLRWGIVRALIDRIPAGGGGSDRRLPIADRVLKSLLVRYAISFRITLPSTKEFERRILEIWERGKIV